VSGGVQALFHYMRQSPPLALYICKKAQCAFFHDNTKIQILHHFLQNFGNVFLLYALSNVKNCTDFLFYRSAQLASLLSYDFLFIGKQLIQIFRQLRYMNGVSRNA